MSHKRYLITGGTGFIGSALVRLLVADGHSVRVLDNNLRGNIKRIKDVLPEIEYIQCDIRDRSTVEQACKDIDCVIHLAYVNGTEFFYSKPDEVLDIGVSGMMNVLYGSRRHNVLEIFLASSSEVYGEPEKIPTDESVPLVITDILNPRFSYSGGKIISELLVINFGRKYFKKAVIFRPHNVYGPDMGNEHIIPQFISRFKKYSKSKKSTILFPIQGSGHESRAYMYIDDAIEAIRLLLTRGKHLEIYNVGTNDVYTTKEVAKEIADYLGYTIKIIPGNLRLGSPTKRCPDIHKISRLGFKRKTSFNQGLQKTIDWYKNDI